MNIQHFTKPAFTLIGKEGSTECGEEFISQLWEQANADFEQISQLVKRNDAGVPIGIWGAMTDFSRTFRPWEENFTRGLYLAGAECSDDASPPDGWVKWTVPGFDYLLVKNTGGNVFADMLDWMAQQQISLAGAVQELTVPAEGKQYLLFPIRRM